MTRAQPLNVATPLCDNAGASVPLGAPATPFPTASKLGARRYTVETLKAGQARPYADDVCHVRVTFEWVPYKKRSPDEAPTFEPCAGWTEEAVAARLRGLGCGFTEYKYDAKADGSMEAYFRTRLDWMREVAPGVWEFQTTSAFTD